MDPQLKIDYLQGRHHIVPYLGVGRSPRGDTGVQGPGRPRKLEVYIICSVELTTGGPGGSVMVTTISRSPTFTPGKSILLLYSMDAVPLDTLVETGLATPHGRVDGYRVLSVGHGNKNPFRVLFEDVPLRLKVIDTIPEPVRL